MNRRLLLSIILCGLFATSLPCAARAADEKKTEAKPSRILYITQSKGFKHGSVNRPEGKLAPSEMAMIQLGESTGLFTVDCSQDAEADMTKENLKNYDIVAFYTTGDLPITQENREYFLNEWLKEKGHGFLGFHSALDTYKDYAPYYEMAGGTFISHPWGSGSKVTLINHDPENPLVKPFGNDFEIQDEIYMYRNWKPENCRVLLSLDYAKSPTGSGVNAKFGYHVPVCWAKNWGEGKVYVNNLGHNEKTWTNEVFLDSVTNAVKWVRGDVEGAADPNPDVSAKMEEKSKQDTVDHGFKVNK